MNQEQREALGDIQRACLDSFFNFTYDEGVYCNPVHDNFLCWPPTKAGSVAKLSCPNARMSDYRGVASRICSDEGQWLDRAGNETEDIGWTNFSNCYTPTKYNVAFWTRWMEMVGFSLSFFALLAAIIIFSSFRVLRNYRTRIHMNLFAAMLLQVLIRLVLYIDQATTNYDTSLNETKGIESVGFVCKGFYIVLEYAATVMVVCMGIEGLCLFKVLSSASTIMKLPFYYCAVAAWLTPVFNVSMWAILMYSEDESQNDKCWYGYNFGRYYAILQVPRWVIFTCNMLALVYILRELLKKLQLTESSELQRLKKGTRAALVLLPLLGITNVLTMFEPGVTAPVWVFALWAFPTYFLRSFEGFFIAFIYCFMNGEVRTVVSKYFRNRRSFTGRLRPRPRGAAREYTTMYFALMKMVRILGNRTDRSEDHQNTDDTQVPDIEGIDTKDPRDSGDSGDEGSSKGPEVSGIPEVPTTVVEVDIEFPPPSAPRARFPSEEFEDDIYEMVELGSGQIIY